MLLANHPVRVCGYLYRKEAETPPAVTLAFGYVSIQQGACVRVHPEIIFIWTEENGNGGIGRALSGHLCCCALGRRWMLFSNGRLMEYLRPEKGPPPAESNQLQRSLFCFCCSLTGSVGRPFHPAGHIYKYQHKHKYIFPNSPLLVLSLCPPGHAVGASVARSSRVRHFVAAPASCSRI